jgi:hypothetical protein
MRKTTKEPVNSAKKLIRQEKKQVIEPKVDLCYNCEVEPISPYETGLCNWCADSIRYWPRIF